MKWLLLFLVFIFCLPIFINSYNENRILNGVQTPLGQFMFLPKIYYSYSYTGPDGAPHTKTSFACSSTIISKRHILTAAHCVKHLKNPNNEDIPEISMAYPYFIDVRPIENDTLPYFHYTNITKFGIESKVHVHSGYKTWLNDDIAIIEFPEGVNFNITPVLLAKDYTENSDDTLIAAGYGNYLFNDQHENVSKESPPTLRHVNVSTQSLWEFFGDELDNMFEEESDAEEALLEIEKWIICAGRYQDGPKRADKGDSGGPLLYEKNGKIYQLGVSSFGNTKDVYAPACYTRVSYYCDWIEKRTNGEAKCQEMPERIPVTYPPLVEKRRTVRVTRPRTSAAFNSTFQQSTITAKRIPVTEFNESVSVNESLPTTEQVTNAELSQTTQSAPFNELITTTEPITESNTINKNLLPTNENSPRTAEFKNGASTFVMNFGFFWKVFFLNFIYVSFI